MSSFLDKENYSALKKMIVKDKEQLNIDLNITNWKFKNPENINENLELHAYLKKIKELYIDLRYEKSTKLAISLIDQICIRIETETKKRILNPLLTAIELIKKLETSHIDADNEIKELKKLIQENKEFKNKVELFDSFSSNPKLFMEKFEEYKEKLNEILKEKLGEGDITAKKISSTLNIIVTDEDFANNLLFKIASNKVRKEWKDKHLL